MDGWMLGENSHDRAPESDADGFTLLTYKRLVADAAEVTWN